MRRSFYKTIALSFLGALSASALAYVPTWDAKQALKNWGLINTEARSHINAPAAWKIEDGSARVVVAVIDTGIDAHHKDLKANLWHDTAEGKPSEYGWNFVTNTPNPFDDHGHGTHVAGIIGAIADPKAGISGVVHHVSIMPVKYFSEANPGTVNLRNTIKALNWAIDHGAKIINYSGGGPEFSEDEYLAIKRAEAEGILVVAAAGNDHENTDLVQNYYYPAAYGLKNIISVAATDIHNDLLPSSNWGRAKVDVAAPGENIYSTLPGGHYGYMSGTSQATAFVSGIAALLLARDPSLKPADLKRIIMESVDPISQLRSKLASGGRVNAYSALLALSIDGHSPRRRGATPTFAARLASPDDLSQLLTPENFDGRAPGGER